jgi:hypothetical protein
MISEPEWQSIASMIEKMIRTQVGFKSNFFVSGKVIRVDKAKKLVYLKEFGDQAVPIISFDYEIDYYDASASGTAKRKAKAVLTMPRVGQVVLVAREMGSQRLPRCLGVIQGKGWFVAEAD